MRTVGIGFTEEEALNTGGRT